MQIFMSLTSSKFWVEHKEHSPLRQLRIVYRLLWALLRPLRTWDGLMHRFVILKSYWGNKAALYRKLKKAGVHTGNRQVIVISQVVHLGDIVACEPVVRQIRSENPQAFMVFALHRNYRELADFHPEIDHVIPLTCVTEWARFASLGIFDRVIDLNIYGRRCEFCQVPWNKPAGNYGITVDNYFNFGSLLSAFSKSAGIISPSDEPRVYPSNKDLMFVDGLKLPPRYVCLHADSNEAIKNIPPSMWIKIAIHINTRWRLPVVEIGLKRLVITAGDEVNRSLCSQLSILQSAEVIRRSILFLGSDSGPAHLANAVGAYGVIVLGHYKHYRQYMPYSGDYANGIRSEILWHNGLVSEMPVGKIIQAIDRRLQWFVG
jgi:heptosyltransferase-3